MQRYVPRTLGLAILLISPALSLVHVGAVDSTLNNLNRAVSYLQHVAYNPALRLCREAPRVAPNTYWIASDNLLAFKALEPYDPTLSSNISSELVQLARMYNLPTSNDSLPLSLRYDVIIRDTATLEIPPRNMTHLTLYHDSYLLKYDIANGTGRFSDWKEYADLLLLVALSYRNQGDFRDAMGFFNLAVDKWDGLGLRDKDYETDYGEGHTYATYKLGLLLYVSGKLGVHLAMENEVVNRIWLMQNQTDGGIFTDIMPDGGRGTSDTNTETTAMVILGITSVRQPVPEFYLPAVVLCVIVLLCLAVTIRRMRHVSCRQNN